MSGNNYRKNEWSGMGERARLIRKSRHLSLDDIAAAAGVAPSTISRFENGTIDTLDMADRLAEAYDISLSELLFGYSEKNPIFPEFLIGHGYYSDSTEAEISRRSTGTFSELVEWLSHEPVSDMYSAGYLYKCINIIGAYRICTVLANGRDGMLSFKQKMLMKHDVEGSLSKLCLPLVFMHDDDEEQVISDFFYYDKQTKRLTAAMPPLNFFRVENTKETATISLGQDAFRLIDWVERNKKRRTL